MLGYLLLALFGLGVLAYFFYPPFRQAIDGWKTMLTSATVAALGVLQVTDLTALFSNPRTAGIAVIVIAVLMAVLRAVTTTPVGK